MLVTFVIFCALTNVTVTLWAHRKNLAAIDTLKKDLLARIENRNRQDGPAEAQAQAARKAAAERPRTGTPQPSYL